MGTGTRKPAGADELARVSLGELIHQHVRTAIELAVHEELRATLGATRYGAATLDGATAMAPKRGA